jgi:putative membrane protein (TIGR04086 family)
MWNTHTGNFDVLACSRDDVIGSNFCTVGMVGVATLMSGIISSRITGSAGLAVGSLTGFFIFLVIISIALIFNGEPITILTLLKLMSSVLGGGIGGIIGVNKKEKIKIR